MKIGPIHVIRSRTFDKLSRVHEFWHQFQNFLSGLAASGGAGHALADQILSRSHGLVHCPVNAKVAPAKIGVPDDASSPESMAAARRVSEAYRRALADDPTPPASCMWELITRQRQEFTVAMTGDDIPAVSRGLASLFQGPLIWGLGRFEESHPQMLRDQPDGSHLHLRFTDSLVGLAEATGAARVRCMEQDKAEFLRPLDVDLTGTLREVERRLGFGLAFPRIAAAFGFDIEGELHTIDSLIHARTVHLLAQLRAGPATNVLEIGGGYGCLAELARRAGVGRYAIFDLPWVNAIQGYFLIRSLPPGSVRLYGETEGDLRVMPYWAIDAEPDGSADFVVNTNSLPEMGLETGRGYVRQAARLIGGWGRFVSINQEAQAEGGFGPQLHVLGLVEEHGGFVVESRCPSWVCSGYVEEVFRRA